MDVRTNIAVLERGLKARDISVARLCRHADIHPTTWVRWKTGSDARCETWTRVVNALADLAPDLHADPPPREAA